MLKLNGIKTFLYSNFLQSRFAVRIPLAGKFIARAKEKNVWGLGLPQRDQSIVFWQPRNRFKVNLPFAEGLIHSWKIYYGKGEPFKLFPVAAEYLSSLNLSGNISDNERFERLEFVVNLILPLVKSFYFCNRSSASVPLKADFRSEARKTIHVAEEMLHGYAILFDIYYRQPNYTYTINRGRVETVGFRVMELIWHLQHLYSFQYKTIPETYLELANKVFWSLWKYESVSEQKNLVSAWDLSLPTGLLNSHSSTQKSISVETLFAKILIWSMVDFSKWQSHQLHFFTSLLDQCSHQVTISLAKDGSASKFQRFFCISSNRGLAMVSPEGNTDYEVFMLDFADFVKNIDLDMEYLRKGHNKPKKDDDSREYLNRLTIDDARSCLTVVRPDLLAGKPKALSTPEFEKSDHLNVFISFEDCYSIIQTISKNEPSEVMEKIGFNAVLSKYSTLLTNIEEEQNIDILNIWQMEPASLNQNETLFRVIEGDRTRPFKIGSIFMFGSFTNMKFYLGYVSSIVRRKSDTVDFLVKKFAGRPEVVVFYPNINSSFKLYGIIYRSQGNVFLISKNLPAYNYFMDKGSQCTVIRNTKEEKIVFGGQVFTSSQSVVRRIFAAR